MDKQEKLDALKNDVYERVTYGHLDEERAPFSATPFKSQEKPNEILTLAPLAKRETTPLKEQLQRSHKST